MNIVVIGSGGREHAIIKKLRENKKIETIWVLPGNDGMKQDATLVPIKAMDFEGIIQFVKEHPVDFAVVAPDDPLAGGLADLLRAEKIPCFGPSKNAAIIEASKIFTKNLMKKYHIPTAAYETFYNIDEALKYVSGCNYPTVIKADGLALGKGVIIANNEKEATDAIKAMMQDAKFGTSGNSIVIEEFLEGVEVSVLCFTDGHTIVPMCSAMDHKRAYDNDLGLNTGGMGSIAPHPAYTEEIARITYDTILLPTIKAMEQENRLFKGCLYCGLMLTKDGPKVIEFNCRFGDPEAQVVLPLLETDLYEIMVAIEEERLDEMNIQFSDNSCACIVLANEGYPQSYQNGALLHIREEDKNKICFAGVKETDNQLTVSGGRILGVIAKENSLKDALTVAYQTIQKIEAEHTFYRKDIGKVALSISEKE